MLLTNNDIVEATNLMDATWHSDEYAYKRNELYWVQGLINHVLQQSADNKNFIAFKTVDKEGKITAFMTGSCYNECYNGEVVMNVDDMIVDYSLGKIQNAKDVKKLFDMMIDYCKQYEIKHWRADSIHESDEAKGYVKFLERNYEGTLSYSFRGRL